MTIRIAEKAGFCFGVRRAADALEAALSEKEKSGSSRRIVTLGNLIHNDEYLKTVKARGAEVLALTFKNNTKILSVADDLMFIPEIDPIFSGVVEIVPLQLLAYFVAKENGCDIDKPKNLAKSVTVE